MISSTQATFLHPDSSATGGAQQPVPRAFTVAPSHPPTHGVHVATLTFRAYGPSRDDLEFFTNFARHAAFALGIPVSRHPARLPVRTRLWTVPKSPFVHKKKQENFWRRTHARAIKVWDAEPETLDRWLQFLRIWEMAGVGMKAQVFR